MRDPMGIIDFFKGQYDYLYFFYGLALFFLAVICFNLEESRPQRLPWFLLGLFGLLHGINEWSRIPAITGGDNNVFPVIRAIILGISYLFLLEFARAGLLRLKGKRLGLWVYWPLLILVVLGGLKYGLNGLNAALRYFMGIPAGLFSAWFIYQVSKSEPRERKSLLALSIILVFYAFVSGHFSRLFGLPAEFIRGVLALFASMALWFYSQTFSDFKLQPQKYLVLHFKPAKWTIALILVTLIGLGWVFTNYFDYYAGVQIIKNSKISKNSPLNQLIRELTRLEQAVISISRSSLIAAVLTSHDPKEIEKAAVFMDGFKTKLGAQGCFLFDARGMIVIPAAGANSAEHAAAKSYAAKPYFKNAISGSTGYYFTMGSTHNERTYYISFPVKRAQDKLLGVIVIKKNISAKPVLQYRLLSILVTLFVCILTIIFFVVLRRREKLIEFVEEANKQLQTVDEMKSDFISVVSHELRTPLTSIKNAVVLLLKGGPNRRDIDDSQRELLEIILNNVNRQARMIGDLLDISKIEAGVIDISKEPVDIVSLAQDVIASLRPQAADKKINLRLIKEKEVMVVPVDSEQTRRVFNNLIVNAIKFTPDNGQISVKLETSGKELKITVTDTGIGISKEDIGKLFNKFYRACDIAARQKGGSGLGLVIAKGLVNAQGGKIWVESSELGKGSSFCFTLPAGET